MRSLLIPFFAATTIAVVAAPARAAFPDISYELGTGSRVAYRLVHPLHKVVGTSGALQGRVAVAKDKLVTPLRLSLPLITLNSGNRNRDGNALLTLAVDRFPQAVLEVSRFAESSRTPGPQGGVTVTGAAAGQLKLHGVTRDITFPLTAGASPNGLTVDAEFDVSLMGHGIERPALLGIPVDDVVRVTVKAVGAPVRP